MFSVVAGKKQKAEDEEDSKEVTDTFIPIATPILSKDYSQEYGYHDNRFKPVADIDEELQNKPLSFNVNKKSNFPSVSTAICNTRDVDRNDDNGTGSLTKPTVCVPYSDSESDHSES